MVKVHGRTKTRIGGKKASRQPVKGRNQCWRCIEGCVKQGHNSSQCIAFSLDGVHAVTYGDGIAIHLWDLAAGKELTRKASPRWHQRHTILCTSEEKDE